MLNPAKIDEVMRLFEGLSLDGQDLGKKGDLGFSNLKIEEKLDVKMAQMSLDDWIGPSNAIEGYVPRVDRSSKPSRNVIKSKSAREKTDKANLVNDLDFTSTIIVGDKSCVPQVSSDPKGKDYINKLQELEGDWFTDLKASSIPLPNGSEFSFTGDSQYGIPEMIYDSVENVSKSDVKELKNDGISEGMKNSDEAKLKSSLKSSGGKKLARSVTWADGRKTDNKCSGELFKVREMSDRHETTDVAEQEDEDDFVFVASANACARALSQAAESVARGEADVADAVSEAGITILAQSHDDDGDGDDDDGDYNDEYSENDEGIMDEDILAADLAPLKWPMKPGVSNSEVFTTEDSWYEPPPDGFSLNLSPFATMYMALFGWITSSSLAYIYGQDDHSHEEYLSVNGREYPSKIVLSDGRSSEIKMTLAGCLGRALPKVVTDLRSKTPIFAIEKEVGNLLNTMSFLDALPSFKLKQWHVIALLFIDALSVCRIPGLAPYMTSGRILLQKVADGAQVSGEEYEILKDLLIPLGRVPQFSGQSGA